MYEYVKKSEYAPLEMNWNTSLSKFKLRCEKNTG